MIALLCLFLFLHALLVACYGLARDYVVGLQAAEAKLLNCFMGSFYLSGQELVRLRIPEFLKVYYDYKVLWRTRDSSVLRLLSGNTRASATVTDDTGYEEKFYEGYNLTHFECDKEAVEVYYREGAGYVYIRPGGGVILFNASGSSNK